MRRWKLQRSTAFFKTEIRGQKIEDRIGKPGKQDKGNQENGE
ncbi:MAG: hypothetical protein ACE5NM_11295 [Sedimentisphaerales bacterium]